METHIKIMVSWEKIGNMPGKTGKERAQNRYSVREGFMAKIVVIGAGVMGSDVALTLAAYGYDILLHDNNADVLANVKKQIKQKIRSYKMMSPAAGSWNGEEILNKINLAEDFSQFSDAEWVVENIIENYEAKRAVYRELNKACGKDTKYAVNTSCISITKLAGEMDHPENVIGMHFMNPVPLKEGIEVIKGYHTSADTVQAAEKLATSIGKKAVVVNDLPGFVANRLSHLFMNEAAYLVQDQVAEPAQVDAIFKMGYGHKMGPLETADLIGLDTVVNSLEILYDEYQDSKFRCCPLLKKMVYAGMLGRKSGEGFYKY